VAGVLVQVACKRLGITPPCKFRTLGFRGEESPWFGIAYIGSRLLLGQLTRAELDKLKHRITGNTLAQHLKELGVDTSDKALQKNRLDPRSVRAYLELHIEQGPVLEGKGIPIGAATAIRGNKRHPFATCRGEYGHSAAMPRPTRRDVVIPTARLIAKADQMWKELFDTGKHDDLIMNFGMLSTNPAEHAMTKIAGEINFSLGISSVDNDLLTRLYDSLMAEARRLEKEFNVSFDFGLPAGTEAVRMSDELIAKVEATAKELNLPSMQIPTVGHDAALFSRAGIPTEVIIVRNQHGSHNIHEAMEISDFLNATKVLANCALSR
jgi:N-carbamoyl-L-amino-acid hydrolase